MLVAGGRVIDPSQHLSAVREIGIAAGRVVGIEAGVPPHQAREVFARGKIGAPGLIDIHGHVYDGVLPISIHPDSVDIAKGVTTIVGAGSAGATTFAGLRKHVVEQVATRIMHC